MPTTDAPVKTEPEAKASDRRSRWRAKRSQLAKDMDDYIMPAVGLLAILRAFLEYPTIGLYALVAIALLTPCILIHEWGHYCAAKKVGMAMEEFSVGFGKRIWSRVDKNGMRWSIKLVPLGGSVKIMGMTPEEVEKQSVAAHESFVHARVRDRLKVVLAGVWMNFVLAWASFTLIALYMAPSMSWQVVALSPVAGIVAVFAMLAFALRALFAAVLSGGEGVTTMLTMPWALETGVNNSLSSGQPLWVYFLMTMGLLNIVIAVMNTLPLYPLDGYHAVVAVFDGFRNRRERKQGRPAPAPLRESQLVMFSRATLTVCIIFAVLVIGRDAVRIAAGGVY